MKIIKLLLHLVMGLVEVPHLDAHGPLDHAPHVGERQVKLPLVLLRESLTQHFGVYEDFIIRRVKQV